MQLAVLVAAVLFVLPGFASVTSATTVTVETSSVKAATITCTIGHACPDNGFPLSNTSNNVGIVKVTSSTMIRTITVQSSAGPSYFSAVSPSSTAAPTLSSVSPSARPTKIIAQGTTSVTGGLQNSSLSINLPAIGTTIHNSSTYIAPTLNSSFATVASSTSTSVALATVPGFQSSETENAPTLTSTIVVTPIYSTVTSTTTDSPSSTALNTNAAARPQPARLFGLVAALVGHPGYAAPHSVKTTIYSTTTYPPPGPRSELVTTTTSIPTTYITKTTSACAWHSNEQACMTNLGFNNAARRLALGLL